MGLVRWARDRFIRRWIEDAGKGKKGEDAMAVIGWLRGHKKLTGAGLGAVAYGLTTAGYPEAAHVLELVAAALFGGGLRSDVGVRKDAGLS